MSDPAVPQQTPEQVVSETPTPERAGLLIQILRGLRAMGVPVGEEQAAQETHEAQHQGQEQQILQQGDPDDAGLAEALAQMRQYRRSRQ